MVPSEEQLKRLAKSYKPGPDKTGLEETKIDQLTYPLTGGNRTPRRLAGYFSTASDVGLFCQMLLNGGTFDGKCYLSAAAVQQMTSTQTGQIMNGGKGEGGYGFGFNTSRYVQGEAAPGSGGAFGHGGAYATNMRIDPEHQLIEVFMIQASGFPAPDGDKARPAFEDAALKAFAK